MTDLDRDGNTVPLDFQLGYDAGVECGRADQRDHKAPRMPEGQGLWWDGWLQGYSNGYRQSYLGMPAPKLFQVIEYSSFFAVRHLPSGAECPLGDGVDALCRDDEEEGSVAISPGTEGFVQEWTDSLNADPMSTLEAYFPELVDQPEEEEDHP